MGNVTNDGSYTYTYDFQSRPLTVNGTSFIYDAFGRVAEEDVSGSVTHVLYQPDGSRFATMQNGSLQNYFMPMVNGMVEVFNSSGNQYIRHTDWLGSSRLATDTNGNPVYDVAYGRVARASTLNSQYTRGCPVQPSVGWAGIFSYSHLRNNAHRHSFLPRPLRLNLHYAGLAHQVMSKTAPRPVFRSLD